MKKILTIATIIFIFLANANAQNKVSTLVSENETTHICTISEDGSDVDVAYPSEWGIAERGMFVPILRDTEEFEPFAMIRTERGVGFISHDAKCVFVPLMQDLTKEVKIAGKTYYQAPNGDLLVERPMKQNQWVKHITGAFFKEGQLVPAYFYISNGYATWVDEHGEKLYRKESSLSAFYSSMVLKRWNWL